MKMEVTKALSCYFSPFLSLSEEGRFENNFKVKLGKTCCAVCVLGGGGLWRKAIV